MPDDSTLREIKEARLHEEMERAFHPLRNKIKTFDENARTTLRLAPFLLVAGWLLMATQGRWYGWVLAVVIILERGAIKRGLAAGITLVWTSAKDWRVGRAEAKKRGAQEAKTARTLARMQEAPAGTFDGIAIDTLAPVIAKLPDGVISREALRDATGLREKKARELQTVLQNGRFLIYASPAANYPSADEPVAVIDRARDRAWRLHPTLRTASEDVRALVVGNTLRRAMGLRAENDPHIIGEPDELAHRMSGLRRTVDIQE